MSALLPSRLQEEIAQSILRSLKESGARAGTPLLELDLCRQFKVSRTPVRGALKLLAARGLAEWRRDRGYMLSASALETEIVGASPHQQEDERIFSAIVRAQASGALPLDCTLERIMRQIDAKKSALLRVLCQMSELELVEKKPGKGWLFNPMSNSGGARSESYAFRRAVESAALMEPNFQLDLQWSRDMRARHCKLREKLARGDQDAQFRDLDFAFHEHLVHQAGNTYMLTAVRQHLRRFPTQAMQSRQKIREAVEEHLQMLDALDNGRNVDAARMMLAHLSECANEDAARMNRESQTRKRA